MLSRIYKICNNLYFKNAVVNMTITNKSEQRSPPIGPAVSKAVVLYPKGVRIQPLAASYQIATVFLENISLIDDVLFIFKTEVFFRVLCQLCRICIFVRHGENVGIILFLTNYEITEVDGPGDDHCILMVNAHAVGVAKVGDAPKMW